MRQVTLRSSIWMSALLAPAWLYAQAEPAPAVAAEPVYFQVRYQPMDPSLQGSLPIPNCSIDVKQILRPYTVKLPAKVKISVYDMKELRPVATVFEGTLTEPKKLDPGYYVLEVEGEKEPIYVAYETGKTQAEIWQLYLIRRLPGNESIGLAAIPGVMRLPLGQYLLHGTQFKLKMECRNKETAVFEVPGYEGLPPVLVPTLGTAW